MTRGDAEMPRPIKVNICVFLWFKQKVRSGDLLTAVISASNGTVRKQAIGSVEPVHPRVDRTRFAEL